MQHCRPDSNTPNPTRQPDESPERPISIFYSGCSAVSPLQDYQSAWPGDSNTRLTELHRIRNDHTQEGIQSAPLGGAAVDIDAIQNPKYVTPLDRLQEEPAWIDCPFCLHITKTKVTHNNSTTTQYVIHTL